MNDSKEKKYLAFMYVGGGSSWYQGTLEPEHAALKCVNRPSKIGKVFTLGSQKQNGMSQSLT